ncbi:MAG: hypothetical protein LBS94_03790 [Prevotellaceae bacterium]|jgi:hypothetical protein|nr:hypothetical protein [Prevotellaceae bacterium]
MNAALEESATRNASRRPRRPRRAAAEAEPVAAFTIPAGYMTGEEFEHGMIEDLTVLYKQHGLI